MRAGPEFIAGITAPPETIHLGAGQTHVPEPLLAPLFVNDRLVISVRRMRALILMNGRLTDLSLTSEAFARGRISPSQLRLLLRVVTHETEAVWLEKTSRLNVRLLEAEVTAASAAEQGKFSPQDGNALDDDEEPGRSVSFECPDVFRAQWEWAGEICRRASGSTEPLWRCAEYIAADFLSGIPDPPAGRPGRFTRPAGVSSSGDVEVDSPWRIGKTPWSAAGDAVQMCADGAAADGVQRCASSRSRVRFWAPDDVAAFWQHALRAAC